MRTESQAHLLRIYVNESDRWEGRAVYETIVRAAREQGLAGELRYEPSRALAPPDAFTR